MGWKYPEELKTIGNQAIMDAMTWTRLPNGAGRSFAVFSALTLTVLLSTTAAAGGPNSTAAAGGPNSTAAAGGSNSTATGGTTGYAATSFVASDGSPANPPASTGSATAAADPAVAPGTYVGLGFDACSAPSSAAMQAWLASPYRAVGIYFGGINRACTQPNLTPEWVATQQASGWHLVPIYLGLQAPCTLSNKRYKIDPAQAGAQGRAQADDAVAAARALGLPRESMLIFDMEAYRTDDAACRTAVLTFISAWNARLHDLAYTSGFYSSMSSGVADQVASYPSATRVRPDYLDFARWDGIATVSDPAIPASYWSPHRRMKQYRGGHDETYGGVTINIDNDYLDLAPLPLTPFGDVNGNGWSDLIAREPATARLYLYPGNGTFFGARSLIGSSWNGMSAIVRLGNFDRTGSEDVIAREAATGYLWLYPRTAATFGARIRIGGGWNGMREITAVGDFNRDGYNDIVAVKASTGILYLYFGHGTSLTGPMSLGTGWNTMDELTGVGDFNRDGYPDLVARQISTGYLFLYQGRGNGFAPRVLVGSGWSGLRDLVSVGDFDRNGYVDLLAVQKSTGYLFRWPGLGTRLGSAIRIGTGWGGLQPLL